MGRVDRIADVWGTRTPHGRDEPWPVRVDLHLESGLAESDVDRWVSSACVLCSNGCGCDIAVKGGRMVGVRGHAVDVVNHGRMGPKGLFGSWAWQGRDRLTRPLVRRDGRLVPTDWDTAMGRVVERSRQLLDEVGPLSHGFYTPGCPVRSSGLKSDADHGLVLPCVPMRRPLDGTDPLAAGDPHASARESITSVAPYPLAPPLQ